MQVISRPLFTGAAITIIAAGIIIVGTAIMVGTIATMDGIGIITAIGVDQGKFARPTFATSVAAGLD
jgi:hypothetical protein